MHEVGDMLDYVTQYSTAYNISVQNKEGVEIVLGDTKTVCDIIDTLYWNRLYITRYENIQDAASQFEKVFKSFIKRRQTDINLMYQSLYDYSYNPIENYNRIEESDTVKGGKDTNTTTEQNNTTYNYGSVETREDNLSASAQSNATDSNNGDDTVSKSVSGFNQPNVMNESERETTNYGKTTTSQGNTTTTNTGTQTNSKNGSDTNNTETVSSLEMTYGATENITSNIHGNIGVTTSQQMIESELEMRKYNLMESIIDEFIDFSTVFM